jgi:hypothetical protein
MMDGHGGHGNLPAIMPQAGDERLAGENLAVEPDALLVAIDPRRIEVASRTMPPHRAA